MQSWADARFFAETVLEVTTEEAVIRGVTSMHHLRVQGLAHSSHKLKATACGAPSLEFVDANAVSLSRCLCEELDVALKSQQAALALDKCVVKTLNAVTDHAPLATARVHNSCIETATISGFRVVHLDGGLLEELHFTGEDLRLYSGAHIEQIECIPDSLSPRLNLNLSGGYAGTVRIVVSSNLEVLIQRTSDRRPLESLVFLGDRQSPVTLKTLVRRPTINDGTRQVTFRRVVFTDVAVAHLPDPVTLEALALEGTYLDLSLSTITITRDAIISPGATILGGALIIPEGASAIVSGKLDDVHLDVNGSLVVTGTLRDCNISVGPFGRVAVEDTATLDRVEFL